MKKISFQDAIEEVVLKNPSYDVESYFFIREALDFTIKMFDKPHDGPERHVSGTELLDGVRKYALAEFGPITKTVLNRWGIHTCENFGEIVFLMVENGILGKTDDDRKEDFAGGYSFEDAFTKPFLPAQAPSSAKTSKSTSAQ